MILSQGARGPDGKKDIISSSTQQVFKFKNRYSIELPGIHENTGCVDPLFMLVFVVVNLILSTALEVGLAS